MLGIKRACTLVPPTQHMYPPPAIIIWKVIRSMLFNVLITFSTKQEIFIEGNADGL